MFTSKDCVYCPPIKAIVHEVIGQGMEEFTTVHIVDIDEEPEVAVKYNISSLPTLMINEEIVLQGGMDDDTVREMLWNQLVMQLSKSNEFIDSSKEALVNITKKYWESLNGVKAIRETMGDYIHLKPYQLTLLSLYSLDPLVPSLLYTAGKQLENRGIMQHFINHFEPRLTGTTDFFKRITYLAKTLVYYFNGHHIFSTYIAENAEVVEVTNESILLEVTGLASATIGVNVGEPLCHFTAGRLAGITSTIIAADAECEEENCLALNDKNCTFKITFGKSIKKMNFIASSRRDISSFERKRQFYEGIYELTINLQNSLLLKNKLRPIGDYIHISEFQPIIICLKFLDIFTGSILYSSGRELGIFGSGKELLYRIINKREITPPFEIDVAFELLMDCLTHPASALTREYGEIHLLPKKKKNQNYRELVVYEYSAISGIQNVNETFCDFFAGFLAGILAVLIGKDPKVKETVCQGTGGAGCTFLLTVEKD